MFMSDDHHDRRSQNDPATAPHHRGLRHRIPYRLLGRRSMGTKRLVVSSKVLLSAIPTQNCDVILTFPAKTEDATLLWLLARLKSRTPALTVHVRHHSHSGIYGFYLTAAYESLLQGAEELSILKPLKSEYGGGMKEFVFEDQDCFAGAENEARFLTSQERQNIVLHFLNDLRATGDDTLEGIKFVESQPIVPMLITKRVISQVFPLHNSEDLKQLSQTWVQAIFSPQPLDSACSYFGVKIALYFAYLGHYTTWLMFPALIGLSIFLFQGTNQFLEDICFLAFTLFNVIWTTLYLKFWTRSSAVFAYRWGTLEKKDDLLKDPRPLFKGNLVKSPVTGHLELYYPPWRRAVFRYLITVPIISFCLLLVFITMLLCFELQEFVNELITSSDLPYVLSFGPKILLAIVVSIMDEVYKQIALWLTYKENYRLEESFETNLVIKLILFQFVNSFLSLFYIGFYLGDLDRLRDQLGVLLITRQVLGNLKEVLLPYVIWKARLYSVGYQIATRMSPASVEKEVRKMTHSGPRDSTSSRKRRKSDKKSGKDLNVKVSDDDSSLTTEEEEEGVPSLTQAEVESAMKKYEDTLDDYLEMSIQFGYIILFSSAFPLAAMCAFVNNLIEIRSDAFKLCLTHQRPFGKRVGNIGIWKDVLRVFSVIAVIVNCTLIGTTGVLNRLCPTLSPTASILSLVFIEHIILFLMYCMQQAIPDTPQTICTEMAKLECQRSDALKQLESQVSPHLNGSNQMAGSPLLRRRRPADGIVKESMTPSPPDPQRPRVITPTSSPERPSDISLASDLSVVQATLCASDLLKPEVPPRTSISVSNESSRSASHIAEKIVKAVLNPTLEPTHKSESLPRSELPLTHSQTPLRAIGKPCVKPVLAENLENDFQAIIRRRIARGERRGRSEPVSNAVRTALRLHDDKEVDIDGREEKDVNISSLRPQTKQSILRGNLRESRLQRLRQDGKGEIRRASSLKHVRRRDRDNSDWIRDVGKPVSQSQPPPVPSQPPPVPVPTAPGDIVHLPPPAPPSSPRTGVGVDSPSLSRAAKLRGELSSLANRVLSRKARSLSSTDLSQEVRPTWKDRHSWRAEMATPPPPPPPKSKSKSISAAPSGKEKNRESVVTQPMEVKRREKNRESVVTQPMESKCKEKTQESVVTQPTEGKPPLQNVKQEEKEEEEQNVNQATFSSTDGSPRAQRESPSKPLSLA